MAWLLMVIPFSRSRSMSSRTWACISLLETVLVISRRRSARVLFPWSIWAIMQKFRIFFIHGKATQIARLNFLIFTQIKPMSTHWRPLFGWVMIVFFVVQIGLDLAHSVTVFPFVHYGMFSESFHHPDS